MTSRVSGPFQEDDTQDFFHPDAFDQAQRSGSDSAPCFLDANLLFHEWRSSEALQTYSEDHQAGSLSDASVEDLSQSRDLVAGFTSWPVAFSGFMPFSQSPGSSQSETAASWLPGTSDLMDEASSDSDIWTLDDSSPRIGSTADMDNTLPPDPEGNYFISSIPPHGPPQLDSVVSGLLDPQGGYIIQSIPPHGPSQLGPAASSLSGVPELPASSSGGPLIGESSPFIRDIVRPCPKGDYCYLGIPVLIACNSCLHKGMTAPGRPLIPLECLPFRKDEDKSVRRHLTAKEILSILYLNTRYGMSFGMIQDLIKFPKSTICRQCNAPRIQEWLKSIPRCPTKNKRNSKIIKNVDDKITARSS
ncbi:MAG: hypothetical protein J3Q66DRAFT_373568 [Benniella sp.]|nr:MAG: hypothetical protein J3Q66DRAFT_373568 [Benniella sp.]